MPIRHTAPPGPNCATSMDELDAIEPAFAFRERGRPAAVVARSSRLSPGRRRGVAVFGACAACLGLLLAPALSLRLRADHRSGVAQVETVTLADGSLVQLAPLSAIAVDYGAGRRDVRLLKGEAFFSVVPDRAHPFRVIGERATVTVFGTAFDVREAPGAGQSTEVSVAHGRVGVASRTGKAALLVAGQGAAVDRVGDLHHLALPATQVAAWRERHLIVQDEPVSQAIDRLRPWFGGMIVTRGDALDRQRLTGVFNAADPVGALRGMARAYGGRITVIGDWLVVYSQD
ncbi:FecR family protein [Novosphingobium sp. BL-52-GroH]|uniref:FecR family protein n=1 Tax=Novosphingobium sp. BL-52-GroH TaxID=3349877 RepID=UPI00384DD467